MEHIKNLFYFTAGIKPATSLDRSLDSRLKSIQRNKLFVNEMRRGEKTSSLSLIKYTNFNDFLGRTEFHVRFN